MDEGFIFFVTDDGGREVRLRNIGDLGSKRTVIIGDKEQRRRFLFVTVVPYLFHAHRDQQFRYDLCYCHIILDDKAREMPEHGQSGDGHAGGGGDGGGLAGG